MPGPTEMWIILIVILLLFGGSQIPRVARSLGKAKREFKEGLHEGEKTASLDSSKEADAESDKKTAEESDKSSE